MAAKPISQSDTRWVKKEGKRGYVEQVSTGKRVTGRVALVKNTTKGKAGTTQRYKAGIGLKQTGKAKPKGGGNGTGSTGSGSNPPPPPPKTGSYQAGKGTTSTAGAKARSAAQGKIYANRNTGSYQAGKGTTPKAGAAKRSAAQGKIYADRNRPSFAKQQAAVAQALVDFRNATTEATKASAKRKYDQHVAVLNGIKDYFR